MSSPPPAPAFTGQKLPTRPMNIGWCPLDMRLASSSSSMFLYCSRSARSFLLKWSVSGSRVLRNLTLSGSLTSGRPSSMSRNMAELTDFVSQVSSNPMGSLLNRVLNT